MRWTTLVTATVLTGCATTLSSAAEVKARIDWSDPAVRRKLPAVTPTVSAPEGDGDAISINPSGPGPASLTLAVFPDLDIRARTWALRGQVSCRDVAEHGYLEMWSYFPNDQRYYSRTLSPSGPMRWLHGSQPWRDFVLPFFNKPSAPNPDRIELRLVLPAGGAVDLGPVELVTFGEGEDPLQPGHSWWSRRRGAMIGAAAGAFLGLLGAAIGVLAGSGRAQKTAAALLWVMTVCGLSLLGLGAAALVLRQPHTVWYPTLMVGAIATVLGFALRPVLRRRRLQQEERRIRALDS